MNSSPWRLEEVDSGDEQYPVESRFAVRHTPPDQQDPVSIVGGLFPPFCGTPDPSRWTGSRFEHGRSNTRPFPLLCGTPGLVSIGCSIQALPMNTTTHSVPTQPVGSP